MQSQVRKGTGFRTNVKTEASHVIARWMDIKTVVCVRLDFMQVTPQALAEEL
jgi:hypothetical protein